MHPSPAASVLAELRCGPIWDLDEIDAYREARARDPFALYRWTLERRAFYRR